MSEVFCNGKRAHPHSANSLKSTFYRCIPETIFKSGVVFPESKTSSFQVPTRRLLKRKTIKLFPHQQKESKFVVRKIIPSFDAFTEFLRCNVHGP